MFIPARGRAARIQELTKALQNPRADRESELFGQANFLLALHEAQQDDRGWTEVAALLRGATERQSRLIDACTAAGEVRRAERLAAEQRQVQQATLAARRAAECAEQAELARQCLKLSASGCIPDLAAAVQRANQAGAECCVPQSVLADAKRYVAAVEAALSTGAAVVDADGDLGAPPIVTEQLARAVCNCKAMEARGSLIVEVASACSVGDRVLQVREALRDSDLDGVARAIQAAVSNGIDHPEVIAAARWMQRRQEEAAAAAAAAAVRAAHWQAAAMESALASACEALVSALATGAQDGWDRWSIATQPLSAAIAQVYASARSTADKTGSTHSLLLEGELVVQLRSGLLQQNWPRVAAAVSSARTLVLTHTAAEFQAASDKVSLQAAVTANGRILAAATHAGDERALLTALVVAADPGCRSSRIWLVLARLHSPLRQTRACSVRRSVCKRSKKASRWRMRRPWRHGTAQRRDSRQLWRVAARPTETAPKPLPGWEQRYTSHGAACGARRRTWA
jgi:hypothetical protein